MEERKMKAIHSFDNRMTNPACITQLYNDSPKAYYNENANILVKQPTERHVYLNEIQKIKDKGFPRTALEKILDYYKHKQIQAVPQVFDKRRLCFIDPLTKKMENGVNTKRLCSNCKNVNRYMNRSFTDLEIVCHHEPNVRINDNLLFTKMLLSLPLIRTETQVQSVEFIIQTPTCTQNSKYCIQIVYTEPQNHDIITKYKPHDDLWKHLIQQQLKNDEFGNHPDVA